MPDSRRFDRTTLAGLCERLGVTFTGRRTDAGLVFLAERGEYGNGATLSGWRFHGDCSYDLGLEALAWCGELAELIDEYPTRGEWVAFCKSDEGREDGAEPRHWDTADAALMILLSVFGDEAEEAREAAWVFYKDELRPALGLRRNVS